MMKLRLTHVCALLAVVGLAGCGANSTNSSSSSLVSSGSSGSSVDSAPGAGIFGRLVSTDQQAIEGASVSLLSSSGTRLAGPVTTGNDGSFHLPLPTGLAEQDGVLVVEAPNHPKVTAPLALPPGARVDVELRFGSGDQLNVMPLLTAPASAVPVGNSSERVLLQLNSGGSSDAFTLTLRGAFAGASADLRLTYRERGGPIWYVGAGVSRTDGTVSLPLTLGARAEAMHGRLLEVRGLAAPAGRLDHVVSYVQPADLGLGCALSPDPVLVVPVVYGAARLAGGGLAATALIAPGGQPGTVRLTAADATALGLANGDTVRLALGARSLQGVLEVSTDRVLSLATMQANAAWLRGLGIDLDSALTGYAVAITPVR